MSATEQSIGDPRHFLKRAANIGDAFCSGRYMGVTIEKVLVNVPITGFHGDGTTEEKTFTLARVLFSNLWDHRITLPTYEMKLIDSEGIQHTAETDIYIYAQEAKVRISKKKAVSFHFQSPEDCIEGRAKVRGWLFFAPLPPGVFPQRFTFRFNTFAPGCVCGRVEDHETLEVLFVFQFRHLLTEAGKFVALEVE
jgi:hypothetical protein